MLSAKSLSLNKMLENVKTGVYVHRREACSSALCKWLQEGSLHPQSQADYKGSDNNNNNLLHLGHI